MAVQVRKAIFPVAGLGTRLLPATKSIPKEMITIVDRPLIQYAVDEAREAGIEQLIFVTGRGKSALVDYFDRAYELEGTLKGKNKSLDVLECSNARFGEVVSVRQQQPLGLGHAVWCARDIVGDEPFAVLLPDELVLNTPGVLAQMVNAADGLEAKANILAIEEVPMDLVHQYGIVGVGAKTGELFKIDSMVEKPARNKAPSNLSITGRYILQPEIFKILETQKRGAGGEIQLTDGMAGLLKSQPFYGVKFSGERHDCGSKAGFLRANIAFGLARPDLADALRADMTHYMK